MVSLNERYAIITSLIIYLAVNILLGFYSNASIEVVFIATLPILLYMILLFTVVIKFDMHPLIFWVLPLSFPLIFIFIWSSSQSALISSMDGPAIMVINILVSYLISILTLFIFGIGNMRENTVLHERNHYKELIGKYSEQNKQFRGQINHLQQELAEYLHLTENHSHESTNYQIRLGELENKLGHAKDEVDIYKNEMEAIKAKLDAAEQEAKDYAHDLKSLKDKLKDAEKELTVTKKDLVVTKADFTVNLRAIEDKCKAINFVIGRVYADKKGGNKQIRSKLGINRVLYNNFSEIAADFNEKDSGKLLELLVAIRKRLDQLELKESEVINPKSGRIPLKREKGQKILDILAVNDKDPVVNYHSDAKEVSDKLINYLKSNY